MKNNKLLFSSLLLSITIGALNNPTAAQDKPCSASEMNEKALREDPIARKAHQELLDYTKEYIATHKNSRSNHIYTIPIVFHIIHNYGNENISDAQIFDAVRILNEDFRRLNSDTSFVIPGFKENVTDAQIEFRLAQKDPNGNCTNGIDRIQSPRTNFGDNEAKLNQWPRSKYLNIWTCKDMENGVAGYAYYPAATQGSLATADGIIIRSEYIGAIGTGSAGLSRALTHEVGHYLNLPHTWGGTNEPGVGCGDEGVGDTPVTLGHTTCALYDHGCTSENLAMAYNFDAVNSSTGTTDPSSAPAVSGANFGSFSAIGVAANSDSSGMFSFSGWDTGAPDNATTYSALTGSINTGKYYEFTVSAEEYAKIVTVTGLSFSVRRSLNGPRTFSVRSSINNFGNNLSSVASTDTIITGQATNILFFAKDRDSIVTRTLTFSSSALTNITSEVTFRIYAWNAEDANGSFSIDNFSLLGTHGTVENVQNFMEYSYCSRMYTNGQRDRMHAALNSSIASRNNLSATANLLATGTNDGAQQICAPVADFFFAPTPTSAPNNSMLFICEGTSLTFTERSENGTPTSWNWEFPGATPSTSTNQSQIVTFDSAGWIDVKLTVSNTAGSSSKIVTIYVSPDYGDFAGQYSENFEDPTAIQYQYRFIDVFSNNKGWSFTSEAGNGSGKSLKMDGYQNIEGDIDFLVTPAMDLRFLTSASFKFDYSAATRSYNSTSGDQLKVYASSNCGRSWTALSLTGTTTSLLTGTALANAGYVDTQFKPTLASQWKQASFSIPATFAKSNTRFKIEHLTGNASNNLFIDNINITGVVGLEEFISTVNDLIVSPNPANENMSVSYNLTKSESINITLYDLTGRVIKSFVNETQSAGQFNFNINKAEINLSSGIYFLKISTPSGSMVEKLGFN